MSEKYLIPQFIIDYLQKSRSTNSKGEKIPQRLASALLSKNKTPEIEKWFKENEVTAGYLWKYFVFYGLDRFSFRECPVCGKRVKLNTIVQKPDARYCSKKCANSSEETKEKYKQTCKEKFGVENSLQAKEIQEKVKQTCLEKYGVEHPSQSKEIQEKYKQTCFKKYGVENPLQSKEVQEKIKQTCKEKFGVESPLESKEIQEKRKQTRRSNYWETFCSLLKEKNIVPIFSKEEYKNDTGRKFKCLLCGEEFKSEGTYTYKKEHKNEDGSYTTLIPYDIFCPHCSRKFSKKEKEVAEFVKSIYNGEILENDRKILEGKELDIYLPNLNLGIEFDGNYWHSKEGAKEKDEKKNQLCEQKGIKLLRIKESDWDNNRSKIENQIKEFLGIN